MKDRPRSSSLRAQILSRTLIVGLVPLVILASVAILGLQRLGDRADDGLSETRRTLAEETALDRVSTITAAASREIDLAVAERLGQVVAVSREPTVVAAVADGRAVLPGALGDLLERWPDVVDVLLTDSTGTVIGGTAADVGADVSSSPSWQSVAGSGLGVGEPTISRNAEGLTIPLGVRVEGPDDTPLGVIQVFLGATLIQEITDLHAVGGTEVAVVAEGPLLLAETATGHDPGRIGRRDLGLDELPAGLQEARSGPAGAFRNDAGIHGFGAIAVGARAVGPVATDGPVWTILASQSSAVVTAPLLELENLNRDIDEASGQLSVVVLVVLLFGGFVATAVAAVLTNRIVGPIGRLTEQARRIADRGLPAAVDRLLHPDEHDDSAVETSLQVDVDNELADLADSFNSVQHTAVRLAAEQAVQRRNALESFGDLGRRNQSLVKRQLRLIDELERSEEDPERLASLFKLDHLATRMRRGAESVLVISGARNPSGRTGPLRMELVVRGALGEVENFERIDVVRFEPAVLAGYVVGDAAHVIAELTDNALSFSAPETRVEVSGATGDQFYTVRIVDEGIGMSDAEVANANEILRRGVDLSANPSRQLGLIVVSKLAAAHDIDVTLSAISPHGVEARIDIPNGLLHVEEKVAGLTASTDPVADDDTMRVRRTRRAVEHRPRPTPPRHREPAGAEGAPTTEQTVGFSATDPLTWSTVVEDDAEPAPVPFGAHPPGPVPTPFQSPGLPVDDLIGSGSPIETVDSSMDSAGPAEPVEPAPPPLAPDEAEVVAAELDSLVPGRSDEPTDDQLLLMAPTSPSESSAGNGSDPRGEPSGEPEPDERFPAVGPTSSSASSPLVTPGRGSAPRRSSEVRRSRPTRSVDGEPGQRRFGLPASARIPAAVRRTSRRPAPPRAPARPGPDRVPKRRVATSESPEEVSAEAEEVQQRWTSFQQGRKTAQAVEGEAGRDEGVDDGTQ